MLFNLVVAGELTCTNIHIVRDLTSSRSGRNLRVYALNGRDWWMSSVIAVLLLFEFGANIVSCNSVLLPRDLIRFST